MVLKPCGALMQVKSTVECSMGAFCSTFGVNLVVILLENLFWPPFEWPLNTGFTVNKQLYAGNFCPSGPMDYTCFLSFLDGAQVLIANRLGDN